MYTDARVVLTLRENMAKTKKKPAKPIEDMTAQEMKELRGKLNELIVDREMAAEVAKAEDDGAEG